MSPPKTQHLPKSLQALSRSEWDALCARCGRCCVIKFVTSASSRVHYTKLACRHLNIKTAQCRCYRSRKDRAPECIDLYGAPGSTFKWLPKSCSYRILMEGGTLPLWHPLVTGNPKSAVKTGMSIVGHVVSEGDSLTPYQSDWPDKPKSRKGKARQ
jgi:uncharacterized cysteine cluster protein YcgN (CxxCxxCC family)